MRQFLEEQGEFFAEFLDHDIPRYAILSHCWGKEEVTFVDLQYVESSRLQTKNFDAPDQFWRWKVDRTIQKEGYAKIWHACKQADLDDLEYVWIDTCCIDQNSSAELQEAINSMYSWYAGARLCYIHLNDVGPDCPFLRDGDPVVHYWLLMFQRSKWFTRGWTLQELLAPQDLRFYSASWELVGTLHSLVTTISKVTRINVDTLMHVENLSSASVSERMSWAAGRKTTRIEDRAYSLLGIFNINIPLLYGEKEKSFQRLQEEIIRTIPDHTILAWQPPTAGYENRPTHLLASSPDDFADGDMFKPNLDSRREIFEMTNLGLRLTVEFPEGRHNSIGILHCRRTDREERQGLILSLDLTGTAANNLYVKRSSLVDVSKDALTSALSAPITIFRAEKHPLFTVTIRRPPPDFITVFVQVQPDLKVTGTRAWPRDAWNVMGPICRVPHSLETFTGAIELQDASGAVVMLVIHVIRQEKPKTMNNPRMLLRAGFVMARSPESACKQLKPEHAPELSHRLGGRLVYLTYPNSTEATSKIEVYA